MNMCRACRSMYVGRCEPPTYILRAFTESQKLRKLTINRLLIRRAYVPQCQPCANCEFRENEEKEVEPKEPKEPKVSKVPNEFQRNETYVNHFDKIGVQNWAYHAAAGSCEKSAVLFTCDAYRRTAAAQPPVQPAALCGCPQIGLRVAFRNVGSPCPTNGRKNPRGRWVGTKMDAVNQAAQRCTDMPALPPNGRMN